MITRRCCYVVLLVSGCLFDHGFYYGQAAPGWNPRSRNKPPPDPFDIGEAIGDSGAMAKNRRSLNEDKAEHDQTDALLDEALRMTFPASDPIAISFDHASKRDGSDPAAASDSKKARQPAERAAGIERKK